jgi:hypothetical protein
MPGLRRVLQTLARFLYRDVVFIHGQFTASAGAVATVLFKGCATITYSAAGTYVLKLLQDDGVTALKGYHLKSFHAFAIAPVLTDGLGSGDYAISVDSLNSAGTITFRTMTNAGAVADAIAVVKISMEISPEAAA